MTQGYRRAALTLHGLQPADREWLMAQLPEGQQAQLGAHLAELVELGIPADRALLDDAMGESMDLPRPSGASRESSLAHAYCDQVLQLLVVEPDQLIALVVKAGPWSWQEELLERLGVERRGRISRLLRQIELRPGLEEALLTGLARRLEGLPSPKPIGPKPLRGQIYPNHFSGIRHSFRSVLKSWLP